MICIFYSMFKSISLYQFFLKLVRDLVPKSFLEIRFVQHVLILEFIFFILYLVLFFLRILI
jgi:hypothetical protein